GVEYQARCSSLRSWWQISRSSWAVGAGSSSAYSTPSTRTTGGVPALRWRSLARVEIIRSSTLRMFMDAPPAGRPYRPLDRLDQEQLLPELYRLGVIGQDLNDPAPRPGFALRHELHGLHNPDL